MDEFKDRDESAAPNAPAAPGHGGPPVPPVYTSAPGHGGPPTAAGVSGQIQGGFAAAIPSARVDGDPFGRELVGYLKELLKAHAPTLEIGAATGILTGRLHRARVDVVACEADQMALAQFRRSLPHVPAICADLDLMPLRRRSIRSVVLVEGGFGPRVSGARRTRTPVADSELRRVLRPGGLFIHLSRTGEIPDFLSEAGPASAPPWLLPVERRPFDNLTVHVWSADG